MGLDVSKVVQPAVRGRDDVLVAAFLLMGNTTFRHPSGSICVSRRRAAGISKSKEANASLSSPSTLDGGRGRACPVWP